MPFFSSHSWLNNLCSGSTKVVSVYMKFMYKFTFVFGYDFRNTKILISIYLKHDLLSIRYTLDTIPASRRPITLLKTKLENIKHYALGFRSAVSEQGVMISCKVCHK